MLLRHRYYSTVPLATPCRACGGRILAKDAAYDAASVAFHRICYLQQPARPDPWEVERRRQARELAAARERDRQRVSEFWLKHPEPEPEDEPPTAA